MLLIKKQEMLAIHIRGVVDKTVFNAEDAISIEFGINSNDICVSIIKVIITKKPIHADFRASLPPYFSFNTSTARDIEQYREFPNVTGNPKISTHFITSIFAITDTTATQTNKPNFPKSL